MYVIQSGSERVNGNVFTCTLIDLNSITGNPRYISLTFNNVYDEAAIAKYGNNFSKRKIYELNN